MLNIICQTFNALQNIYQNAGSDIDVQITRNLCLVRYCVARVIVMFVIITNIPWFKKHLCDHFRVYQ